MLNAAILILAAAAPLAVWWRLGNAPLDRDWTPYCYPAIFRTPYLGGGHTDIKPPFVHWSFKCWLTCYDWLAERWTPASRLSLAQRLRLLPALSSASTIFAVWIYCAAISQQSGLPGYALQRSLGCAMLLCLPSLWVHMANTEWMTTAFLSWSAALTALGWNDAAWLALGCLPMTNLKNLPLMPLWALSSGASWPTPTGWLAVLAPAAITCARLWATGRMGRAWLWTISLPSEFGKARRISLNTRFDLLKPTIWQAAPLFVTATTSPWMAALLSAALLSAATKQVVPHHLIGLVVPFCLAIRPTWWALGLAAGVVLSISWKVWRDPKWVYPATFFFPDGGHYGMTLASGAVAAEKVKKLTQDGEAIWVNGMENNIYIMAGRPAWWITVPETRRNLATDTSDPAAVKAGHLVPVPDMALATQAPRVIVHCYGSAVPFDYSRYKPAYISGDKALTIMVRQPAAI